MKDCKKTYRNLVAFLYGELGEHEKEHAEAHIKTCPKCTDELRRLREVYDAADTLNPDIEEAMESVDWENLPARIADGVFSESPSRVRRPRRTSLWPVLLQPRFRFAYVGLIFGIIIGAVITFMMFRPPALQVAADGRIIVPQGFYDKMELEMARRDTIDYLDKSEYLLLDFIQSSPEKSIEFWQSEYASLTASELLSKKKYIDTQLDNFNLAKAKVICDQIELLFFELTQISEELSVDELRKIQQLIEERQLLLKIKLVRKELQKSEV